MKGKSEKEIFKILGECHPTFHYSLIIIFKACHGKSLMSVFEAELKLPIEQINDLRSSKRSIIVHTCNAIFIL